MRKMKGHNLALFLPNLMPMHPSFLTISADKYIYEALCYVFPPQAPLPPPFQKEDPLQF